jgi:small subunit ribosomal protein S18
MKSKCRFCNEQKDVDYKDVNGLQKLCTYRGKILARRRSGNCAKHQGQTKLAIKYARYLGLLSYTSVIGSS